jgi:hypothetical protein
MVTDFFARLVHRTQEWMRNKFVTCEPRNGFWQGEAPAEPKLEPQVTASVRGLDAARREPRPTKLRVLYKRSGAVPLYHLSD